MHVFFFINFNVPILLCHDGINNYKMIFLLQMDKNGSESQFFMVFVFVCIYRIVPNLDDDDSPTSKSDESNDDEVIDLKSVQIGSTVPSSMLIQNAVSKTLASLKCTLQGNTEDDEIGDGLRTTAAMIASATPEISEFSQQNYGTDRSVGQQPPPLFGKVERRRRKLPEIPKNRKCKNKSDRVRVHSHIVCTQQIE